MLLPCLLFSALIIHNTRCQTWSCANCGSKLLNESSAFDAQQDVKNDPVMTVFVTSSLSALFELQLPAGLLPSEKGATSSLFTTHCHQHRLLCLHLTLHVNRLSALL